MLLHKAVKKAMEVDGFIARKEIEAGKHMFPTVIKPTNSYATCIIITKYLPEHPKDKEKSDRCKNWNPTADDLMANDWEVVTE